MQWHPCLACLLVILIGQCAVQPRCQREFKPAPNPLLAQPGQFVKQGQSLHVYLLIPCLLLPHRCLPTAWAPPFVAASTMVMQMLPLCNATLSRQLSVGMVCHLIMPVWFWVLLGVEGVSQCLQLPLHLWFLSVVWAGQFGARLPCMFVPWICCCRCCSKLHRVWKLCRPQWACCLSRIAPTTPS